MKGMVKLAALGASALLLVAFVGGASGQPAATPSAGARTITVTGTGTVSATPDRAEFAFGVSTAARTATQALASNAADMQKVIAALKAAGVPAASIQTQTVSLDPRYSQDGDEILGYNATNSVSARISAL